MTILKLVDKNDPILTTKLERFSFSEPPTDPVQLAVDLTETMLFHKGLGLAANQLGLPYRVFSLNANPVLVMFNPIIVHTSEAEDQVLLEEGCLTLPGYYVKIKRPRTIKMRYTLPNGETETKVFGDMTARIIQHEVDHLDGIMFTKRATLYHREQAERGYKKFSRQNKHNSSEFEIARVRFNDQKKLVNSQMELTQRRLDNELQA